MPTDPSKQTVAMGADTHTRVGGSQEYPFTYEGALW
jgi:hypothetical protein